MARGTRGESVPEQTKADEAPSDGIEFRADNWSLVVESGFTVAPASAIPDISNPAEAAALFTNEFYDALLIALPETPLKSPYQTLQKLDAAGGSAHARVQSLRRRLYSEKDLTPEELAAISRDLEDRYLMVSWFEEAASDGVQGVRVTTPGGGQYETTEYGPTYSEVAGQATGVVIDLWMNEILWRGVAHYTTERLYVKDGEAESEVDRTRASAAIRLAEFTRER